MTVSGTDALLGGPGSLGVGFEQGFVVVGLNKESVDTAESLDHAARDEASITEQAELGSLALKDESNRIHRVVLDGKGFNLNTADVEDLASVENFPRGTIDPTVFHDAGRGGGGVNRDRHLLEQDPQAADVVAVLVGEENPIEGVWRKSQPLHAGKELLGTETRIDEQSHPLRLDHRRIS